MRCGATAPPTPARPRPAPPAAPRRSDRRCRTRVVPDPCSFNCTGETPVFLFFKDTGGTPVCYFTGGTPVLLGGNRLLYLRRQRLQIVQCLRRRGAAREPRADAGDLL